MEMDKNPSALEVHGSTVRRTRVGRRAFVGMAASVGLFASGCSTAGVNRTDPFPRSQATAAGTPARTISNEGGQVTVEVTWAGPVTGAGDSVFNVVLDTHAVDLDRYDLRDLAVLRTDTGIEVRPTEWQAPKGGHHRQGPLVFPNTLDGRPVLGPDTRTIELIIRDVAGVGERSFTWPL
jgi:hypothetical protein